MVLRCRSSQDNAGQCKLTQKSTVTVFGQAHCGYPTLTASSVCMVHAICTLWTWHLAMLQDVTSVLFPFRLFCTSVWIWLDVTSLVAGQLTYEPPMAWMKHLMTLLHCLKWCRAIKLQNVFIVTIIIIIIYVLFCYINILLFFILLEAKSGI